MVPMAVGSTDPNLVATFQSKVDDSDTVIKAPRRDHLSLHNG
jgi:hypothetical protein